MLVSVQFFFSESGKNDDVTVVSSELLPIFILSMAVWMFFFFFSKTLNINQVRDKQWEEVRDKNVLVARLSSACACVTSP